MASTSSGCIPSLTPRRIPPQNVVYHLQRREIHPARAGAHFHSCRKFYTTVFPNFTVDNVEKPPCFLRKFSPDGRFFIAFSLDQKSLEIYEFHGPTEAEDLLGGLRVDCLGKALTQAQDAAIRTKLFARFFHQKHMTTVAANEENLNRECSLFTDDGKYVIVGSAVYVPEDPHPYFYDVYRNNESVSPTSRSPLEDYTLHIVELETGRLKDSRKFHCDKIFLSLNQGLYLYRSTLAVLSVQQQTIHIFQITDEGHFVDVRTIGRFCYEDDALIISSVRSHGAGGPVERPYREPTINSLKHRLLVFLYRRAAMEGRVQRFYQYFEQFRALRMWKMQLLDEHHLLMKYGNEDVVTLKVQDPNSQPSFFVVYNMVSTEVVAVYENTSEALLGLYENFCDLFRNATLQNQVQFTCSPSSNIYARQTHERFKHTIINAKFGGHTEAVKRLLAQLPISAQSYSSSPYLDLALFSYDDKWVSAMERPKTCGDHPIRYNSIIFIL